VIIWRGVIVALLATIVGDIVVLTGDIIGQASQRYY
jgi:hypothetical protein